MNNSQTLLICRTQGILDVILSAIFLPILVCWLDRIIFEPVNNGLVIKYSGEMVGDIRFLASFNDTEAKACGVLLMEQSADYIIENFAKDIYIVTAAILGFLTLGVCICIFTVIQNRWALRTLFLAEFTFSLMLLVACIIFYNKSYCILEYATTSERKYSMQIPTILILLVPIFIFLYKGAQLIMLFFLDQIMADLSNVPIIKDERRDSEAQRQELIDLALERAASPNTTAVYVTSSKQNQVVVLKSRENSNDRVVERDERAQGAKIKNKRTGRKRFRRELAKTAADEDVENVNLHEDDVDKEED